MPSNPKKKISNMKYSWTGHKISYNGIFKDKKLLQLEHAPLGLNYCISSGFLHLKSYLSQKKYSPYKSCFIRWCHPQSFKRAVLMTCLYDRSKSVITKINSEEKKYYLTSGKNSGVVAGGSRVSVVFGSTKAWDSSGPTDEPLYG